MRTLRPSLIPLLAGSMLLSGCDSEAAELAQEINAARAGCTQEKLRAGDEECIQMMQRYAEMGTEAMHTYIGAVRAMDEALQRMPPPNFDTAGLGHALSRPLAQPDTGVVGLLSPSAPSLSRSLLNGAGYAPAPYDAPRSGWSDEAPARDPRPWIGAPPRETERSYRDQGAWEPGYPPAPHDPRGYPAGATSRRPEGQAEWLDGWQDPRGYAGHDQDPRGYDPRANDPRRYDTRAHDPRGYDPRDYDPRDYEPRDHDPRGYEPRDPGERQGSYAAPPAPRRGVLLPPGQRLQRPWLQQERPQELDPRYGAPPRRGYLPARSSLDTLDTADPRDPRHRRYQRP